jgi:hypothetical protein
MTTVIPAGLTLLENKRAQQPHQRHIARLEQRIWLSSAINP